MQESIRIYKSISSMTNNMLETYISREVHKLIGSPDYMFFDEIKMIISSNSNNKGVKLIYGTSGYNIRLRYLNKTSEELIGNWEFEIQDEITIVLIEKIN